MSLTLSQGDRVTTLKAMAARNKKSVNQDVNQEPSATVVGWEISDPRTDGDIHSRRQNGGPVPRNILDL